MAQSQPSDINTQWSFPHTIATLPQNDEIVEQRGANSDLSSGGKTYIASIRF